MYDRHDRTYVAWDIETTGFDATDQITVAGFWFPGGHATLIVNAGPHPVARETFEASLADTSGAAITVLVANDEPALLHRMQDVMFDRFDRNYNRLVAYNADSWSGGFDLPFTRTRCIKQGVDWPFDSIPFADLCDPVSKRLNTTHTAYGTTSDVNTLTGAHALLLQHSPLGDALLDEVDGHAWYATRRYDPFQHSGSAVTHYQDGDLLAVCEHNLADIHRTWELGKLIRTFVAPKDITGKKL